MPAGILSRPSVSPCHVERQLQLGLAYKYIHTTVCSCSTYALQWSSGTAEALHQIDSLTSSDAIHFQRQHQVVS